MMLSGLVKEEMQYRKYGQKLGIIVDEVSMVLKICMSYWASCLSVLQRPRKNIWRQIFVAASMLLFGCY
jgi:hypothetical protein